MRPPPIVSEPFPAQRRPWVHRCAKHGCRMVENEDDGGIHCPICAPNGVWSYEDMRRISARVRELREWLDAS